MRNSEHHQTFSISCYLLPDANVLRAVVDGTDVNVLNNSQFRGRIWNSGSIRICHKNRFFSWQVKTCDSLGLF